MRFCELFSSLAIPGWLALLGAFFTFWSFSLGAVGTPPEKYSSDGTEDIDFSEEILGRAYREVARRNARLTLFAAITLGLVGEFVNVAHSFEEPWNGTWVIISYIVIIILCGYMARDLRNRHEFIKESIFEAFYYGKRLSPEFDYGKLRELFFARYSNIASPKAVLSKGWVFTSVPSMTAEEMAPAYVGGQAHNYNVYEDEV